MLFRRGQVEIAAHLVYELDPEGKQLRVVRYTDYAAETVRTLCPSAPELRQRWADARGDSNFRGRGVIEDATTQSFEAQADSSISWRQSAHDGQFRDVRAPRSVH